ncbi:MAG: class I SAM-dependent methyltransferase [Candidatus Micrarchaeia archaeon]
MRKFVSLWGLRNETELEGKTMLDAGCGTGEKAVYFAKLGARVTALDINEKQLSYAKRLAKKHDVSDNIEFVCDDILTFNLGKKFDFVLCSGVLHHTPNVSLGVSSLSRHLKPNGRIILGLYNKYSRVHYRTVRWLLHSAFNKNPQRIMGFVNSFPVRCILKGSASQQTVYDRYAVPYESYHTLQEVRGMFKQNSIRVLHISPETVLNSDLLSQLLWLIKGKTFFFVSGIKC